MVSNFLTFRPTARFLRAQFSWMSAHLAQRYTFPLEALISRLKIYIGHSYSEIQLQLLSQ